MSNQPDPALLRLFVQGDRQAFETLYRMFEPEVHRWMLRIVRERSIAEDGVVEAFWRCYRSRARFDPTRSFGAWMRRIATHVASDQLRALRRYRSTHATQDAPDFPEEPEAAVEGHREVGRQAQAASIGRAFDALPEKLRIVATLALIEECTHAEIAEALDVPIGTVKSRLFRATQKLREALNRAGELHDR